MHSIVYMITDQHLGTRQSIAWGLFVQSKQKNHNLYHHRKENKTTDIHSLPQSVQKTTDSHSLPQTTVQKVNNKKWDSILSQHCRIKSTSRHIHSDILYITTFKIEPLNLTVQPQSYQLLLQLTTHFLPLCFNTWFTLWVLYWGNLNDNMVSLWPV